ncbi:dehydrogenase related to short-chain alcohol dehydrogenases [Corynebacterium jeikeium]|nr:SDR family oxidoreductase [Corynebacterium jeikeium]SUY84067.1 dehydrogenase related to short-chain alcohol dehydrogenases [Corynebacterium jeikeium]
MTKLSSILPFPSLPLPAVNGGVAIVTGASSGIGRATVAALAELRSSGEAGAYVPDRIIGTSRNPDSITDPIDGVDYLPLDLEAPTSIDEFATRALALGPPTVLVNNAGESQSGPLEELPNDALHRLFEINVLGQVGVTKKILPAMRAQGAGRIVMVGSMLGSFPLAYRSSYVASKAAIKGFAFAARREVQPFGVGMSVVEPGSINTGLSARRTKYVDLQGPYGAEFTTMLKNLDNNEANGISAERVAEEILKPITAARPKPLYATGSMAPVVFPLSRVLPTSAMHWLINRKHGL